MSCGPTASLVWRICSLNPDPRRTPCAPAPTASPVEDGAVASVGRLRMHPGRMTICVMGTDDRAAAERVWTASWRVTTAPVAAGLRDPVPIVRIGQGFARRGATVVVTPEDILACGQTGGRLEGLPASMSTSPTRPA